MSDRYLSVHVLSVILPTMMVWLLSGCQTVADLPAAVIDPVVAASSPAAERPSIVAVVVPVATPPLLVVDRALSAAGEVQYERGQALYRDGDPANALREWLPLAEAGYAESQYMIGMIYEKGEGVGINLDQAIRWLTLAAKNGEVMANCRIGHLLNVKEDERPEVILAWFLRGAEAGDGSCMHDLAELLLKGVNGTKDVNGGMRWLTRAAESGDARSQADLGEILLRGSYGVRRDLVRARSWLLNVGEQPGFADETYYLGYMFHYGLGGARDAAKAAHYYAKATELGQPQSTNSLGLLYRSGDGVLKDNARAAELFQRALDLGNMEAAVHLGDLYFLGESVAHDLDAAVALYMQAAEAGLVSGDCRISAMLLHGQGLPRDITMAAKLEAKVRAKLHGANCRTPLTKLLHR